jgi:hypothetical protein
MIAPAEGLAFAWLPPSPPALAALVGPRGKSRSTGVLDDPSTLAQRDGGPGQRATAAR